MRIVNRIKTLRLSIGIWPKRRPKKCRVILVALLVLFTAAASPTLIVAETEMFVPFNFALKKSPRSPEAVSVLKPQIHQSKKPAL